MNRVRRSGFTLVELLIVLAIIAIILSLLLPAVQRVRETAARAKCANNLKQLSLGLHGYASSYGVMPPGYKAPGYGVGWGWGSYVLPFVEQTALFAALGMPDQLFGDGVSSAPPTPLTQTQLSVFVCPSDTGPALNPLKRYHAKSNYRGICGPTIPLYFYPDSDNYGGVLFQNSKVRLMDITDGTANTLALGECVSDPDAGYVAAVWVGMECSDGSVYVSDCYWSVDDGDYRINGPGAQAFGSRHAGGGAQFGFCDGSVRFIRDTADVKKVQILAGRNDGLIADPDGL